MAKGKLKRFRQYEDDGISLSNERKRHMSKERNREEGLGGFACSHCNLWAVIDEHIGTHNRNHCPHCLWSKHLDESKLGDRKSDCKNGMEPIALTFKAEGVDKYSIERKIGELMIVHECTADDMIRINRIASDDNVQVVLGVFESGQRLSVSQQDLLLVQGIRVATQEFEREVMAQLFGNI